MNEITQTNLNIIPAEDIEYLTKQSTAEIGKIVAGMTSLMRDTDARVDQFESQGWFQRMCKTVTGSNKASREVIQQNNAKMGAYMAEAVSVLYDRQLIDEKLITNLGLQISMLYADHVQMKKQLGAFTSRIDNLLVQTFETFEALGKKLNKKIESVDNYHILFEEITLGHYSDIAPILAICEITSQLDERVMKDERRLKNLKEIIVRQEIINDEQRQITDYLNDMFALPAESIGQVAMEFATLYEKSPIAQLLLGITENYHYLPETAKKMKKKSAIVEHVLNEYEIDDSVTFSTRDIYEDFVNAKSEIYENCIACVASASVEETANALYADAEKAYDKEDYKRAFELYIEAANLGNANAIYSLGWMYEHGEGVQQDYEEAMKWYRKAADLGNANAIYSLGWMYESGEGVEENYDEALKWYRKAADLGKAAAMRRLGHNYNYAWGVEQDYGEALKWYRKAADLGDADAMDSLGDMYKWGRGVEEDYDEAMKWYRKAADLGNADAMGCLGEMYCNGDGVEQDYGEAMKWWRKAADLGEAVAMRCLGEMYCNGDGVEQNYGEAMKWWRKAADLGDAVAMRWLGGMYYSNDHGVEQDDGEALKWFRKAADLGDAVAMYCLGEMYDNGYGVEQDYYEALKWYRKAADLGNADAMGCLGAMYEEGIGCEKDTQKAIAWYNKAVENGAEKAQKALDRLRRGGEYVMNGNTEEMSFTEKAMMQSQAAKQHNERLYNAAMEALDEEFDKIMKKYNIN